MLVIPGQIPEVHRDIAQLFVDQRHIGQRCRTHGDVLFFLLDLFAIKVSMEFRFTLLLSEMLKAQVLHHLVQRDGIKALYDLQPASRRQLQGLLFQALKEIALNTAHVDLLESADLVFPLHADASSYCK